MRKKAFTLVELLVVIVILGILSISAFYSWDSYSQNTRNSVRLADLKHIEKTLDMYKSSKSRYPLPNNGTQITFQGEGVWTQGTFGERSYIDKISVSSLVKDPLSGIEYAYSTVHSRDEFQVATVLEGDYTYNTIGSTYASGKDSATAYVRGNYNGKVIKIKVNGDDYILGVPSIIASDITSVDVLEIVSEKKLVYTGFSNLPASFAESDFDVNGGFDFLENNPVDIVVFQGDITDLSGEESFDARKDFLENLQNVYSGSIIAATEEINDIATVNLNNNDNVEYASSVLVNKLGGSQLEVPVQLHGDPVVYNCETQPGYGNAQFTAGSPSNTNQTWQNNNSDNPCYYECINGYTGSDCSTAPLMGWRALDSNCTEEDIVVGTQTWAGCNSTLGNGLEWGQTDADVGNGTYSAPIGDCNDYNGNTTGDCTPENTEMHSDSFANDWFTGTNTHGDAEVAGKWGKFYTWDNSPSACPSGYHVPTHQEWDELGDTLYGSTCASLWSWNCSGLGWMSKASGSSRLIVDSFKIPLSGFHNESGEYRSRGAVAQLWTSSETMDQGNAFMVKLRSDLDGVMRNNLNKANGFSVRCIKD
ncbi:MAG: prepilin-type N-terminal cleavage/methylation domain-containing protein [Candidatus Gracilibacteria bacterium]|nr:prepilin-type N-terminal cleavage/methylation domain-containing protein [Candidatus Gracilibacteria bacterium]